MERDISPQTLSWWVVRGRGTSALTPRVGGIVRGRGTSALKPRGGGLSGGEGHQPSNLEVVGLSGEWDISPYTPSQGESDISPEVVGLSGIRGVRGT